MSAVRLPQELRERGFSGGAPREILYDRIKTAAKPRAHATTNWAVNKAFAEERVALRPLLLAPYRAMLKLDWRVSHDGMISVDGNAYSVPDTGRRRVLGVHCLIDEVQIFEDGVLIARQRYCPGVARAASIQPIASRCSARGSSSITARWWCAALVTRRHADSSNSTTRSAASSR